MERAQKALKEQLERNHNRVSLKLAEKEEEVSRMRKTREDVGVELYGLQQQLAKLQMTLERFLECVRHARMSVLSCMDFSSSLRNY